MSTEEEAAAAAVAPTNEGEDHSSEDEKEAGKEEDAAPRAQLAELPLEWTQMGQQEGEAPVIRYPSEVVQWNKEEDEEIMSVGTAGQKITRMGPKFYEEVNPKLKQLIFRSHLIRTIEGLEGLKELELLELYDNMVDELSCLKDGEGGAPGTTLKTLDISYNVIRDMQPVEFCPNLTELYIANNKLKTMTGLKGLTKLRKLDLGANRIRIMEVDQLSGLVNLEELWLGKNKIEKIQGLEKLTKLRRLDIQSNRLTQIEGLSSQSDTLEELMLAHNGLTTEGISLPTGLALPFPQINVIDLSRNQIVDTAPLAHLKSLEELWLSGNKIATFDHVQPLKGLGTEGGQLDTVYLEYNPVASEFEYRIKVAEIIPSLKQIDANMIGGLAAHGIPTAIRSSSSTTTAAEEMRRLQDLAIAKAKEQSGKK